MKPVPIRLEEKQYLKLLRLAKKRNISMAEIIRNLIDNNL